MLQQVTLRSVIVCSTVLRLFVFVYQLTYVLDGSLKQSLTVDTIHGPVNTLEPFPVLHRPGLIRFELRDYQSREVQLHRAR